MLPAFIIEEIRRRERDRTQPDRQPRVDLPIEPPRPPQRDRPDAPPPGPARENDDENAIVTIDFG